MVDDPPPNPKGLHIYWMVPEWCGGIISSKIQHLERIHDFSTLKYFYSFKTQKDNKLGKNPRKDISMIE